MYKTILENDAPRKFSGVAAGLIIAIYMNQEYIIEAVRYNTVHAVQKIICTHFYIRRSGCALVALQLSLKPNRVIDIHSRDVYRCILV